MTPSKIRRVQIIAFAMTHIPFVALGAYALSDGISRHLGTLAIGFVSTLVAAVALVVYLKSTLGGLAADPARG